MKNLRMAILSGPLMLAFASLLSGCYMSADIDSQPKQEPKIVVDAKSEYTGVASVSADPITFSISSNSPWQITTDSESWCSFSPGSSATSSLVSSVTVEIEDNDSKSQRTATLTISAEGVEKPVIVKITQNGLSDLEISNLSGDIPQAGGSVTFTVFSSEAWSVNSSSNWISFSPSSGEGSSEPVTVRASAVATDLLRTAVVNVSTADAIRSLSITQEGATVLEFVTATEEERTFAYNGQTKTFSVNASMNWKVSSDNADVQVAQTSNTQFTVTLPYSKYIADRQYTITLSSDDENVQMPSKTMTVIHKACAVVRSQDAGALSGNTFSLSGNSAYVQTHDYFKYGTFVWTFSNVNLQGGYFDINNWGSNDMVMMIRFGGSVANGTANNLFSVKGHMWINETDVYWGIDTGWDNGWGSEWKYTTDIALNDLKTLKLEILPTTRSGYKSSNVVTRKVWVNDVLVFVQSLEEQTGVDLNEFPNRPTGWAAGDIWQSGSSHPGFRYLFGVGGNATGSITVDSFVYTPNE